jgi:hypothetical protein
MPRPTYEELQEQVARLHSQMHSYRRSSERWYNRTRSLEAAIKKHARRECGCKGTGECLTRLVARTPVNDRPSLRQMRNKS